MKPPKCRLFQHEHWFDVNCQGKPHRTTPKGAVIDLSGARLGSGAPMMQTPDAATRKPAKNIRGEGRRVLKGSTGAATPAKPTRSASTEKADPPTPAKAPADSATEDKAGLGNPKPRMTKKKWRKKK